MINFTWNISTLSKPSVIRLTQFLPRTIVWRHGTNEVKSNNSKNKEAANLSSTSTSRTVKSPIFQINASLAKAKWIQKKAWTPCHSPFLKSIPWTNEQHINSLHNLWTNVKVDYWCQSITSPTHKKKTLFFFPRAHAFVINTRMEVTSLVIQWGQLVDGLYSWLHWLRRHKKHIPYTATSVFDPKNPDRPLKNGYLQKPSGQNRWLADTDFGSLVQGQYKPIFRDG